MPTIQEIVTEAIQKAGVGAAPRVTELEAQVASLQAQLATLQTERDRIAGDLAQAQTDLTRTQSELSATQSEVESLKKAGAETAAQSAARALEAAREEAGKLAVRAYGQGSDALKAAQQDIADCASVEELARLTRALTTAAGAAGSLGERPQTRPGATDPSEDDLFAKIRAEVKSRQPGA